MAESKAQILRTVVDIGGQVNPQLGKSLKKAQGMLKANLGKVAMGGLLAGATAFLKKTVEDYGNAFRTIRIGTGATGKALDHLMEDARQTMKGTSSSMEEVAKAVADYNTAFGATGKELQLISRAALDVSKVFGEDVGRVVRSSSAAMKAWNVEVKDGARLMDFYASVSQNTGMGIAELQEETARYAPQLRSLGYSVKSSAVLLGNLSKEGIKGEKAMSALNRIASVGADGWAGYYEAIHDAGSEQEAMRIASELFGKETAPMMARAIRSEAFAVGDLTERIDSNLQPVSKLRKETETFGDVMSEIGNGLEAIVMPAVMWVAKKLRDALKWWRSENGQAFLDAVGGFFRDVGDFLGHSAGDALASLFASDKATGFKGLPKYASGGVAVGPSICGEAGPETVISYNPAYRAENLRYWAEAGRALGVLGGGTSIDMGGLTFSPSISMGNGSDGTDIIGALRRNEREFAEAIVGALEARLGRAF